MANAEALIPHMIGFNRLSNEIQRLIEGKTKGYSTYPPYNIVQIEDDKYQIEMSVAGFNSNDLSITFDNKKIVVKGEKKERESVMYLHKGLAQRDFVQTFLLNENTIVTEANIVDGVLVISIEHIIPDNQKPKQIPIGVKGTSTPTLLTE